MICVASRDDGEFVWKCDPLVFFFVERGCDAGAWLELLTVLK